MESDPPRKAAWSEVVEDFLARPAWQAILNQMTEEIGESLLGQWIAQYKIEGVLGVGGMGEVFLATDTQIGRKVALKLLPTDFTGNTGWVRRFKREARAAGQLNHPNIVIVYEIGEIEGRHFIVTEYVEGQTLRAEMAGGAMNWRRAMEIAMQVASALTAAHKEGVVHRDIKPENVMVRPDGVVKVLDFGLAIFVGNEASMPLPVDNSGSPGAMLTGGVMGTVLYMSPEQARGEKVDHRTDIFSLGVVLYEMLAGRTPFSGTENERIIRAILEQEPASLDLSAAPGPLLRIVARALAKDPAQRYATVTEMLDDLQGVNHRMRRIGRRKVMLRAAAMALVLVLSSTAIWLWRANRKPLPPAGLASIEMALVGGKIDQEAVISPDRRLVASTDYVADSVSVNRGLWIRDLTTGAEKLLVGPELGYDCRLPTFTPDGGSIYFLASRQSKEKNSLYQIPVSGGTPRRVLDRVDSAVAFAPDGSQFAFMREDRGRETTRDLRRRGQTMLFVASSDGSRARPLVARQEPDRIVGGRAAWSPDGRRIAFAAGVADRETRYQLYQVEIETGVETPLFDEKWQSVEDIVWMHDNSGLALVGGEQKQCLCQVWFLSLSDRQKRLLVSGSVDYTSLSAPNDSRTLFAVQYKDRFGLWTMPVDDFGRIREIATIEEAGHYGIEWMSGQILYAGKAGRQQQLWLTDVNGQNNCPFTLDGYDSDGPSLSPDNRYLVFCSQRDDGGDNIWRMELGSRRLKQLSRGRLDVDPKCSPDGRWVVYTSWDERQKASIWKVPLTGGVAVELAGEINGNPSPAISPDSRKLAYYREQGNRKWIEIISLETRRLLRKIEVRQDFYLLEWTRDGTALTYAESVGRITNLYRLPLNGESPRRLTDFSSHTISWFVTSRDGAQMALSRYPHKRDLVRITNFR